MTALIGAVLGIAASEMSRNKYESKFYIELHKYYAVVGAGLGFGVGVGQECIRELKKQRDKELINNGRHHNRGE